MAFALQPAACSRRELGPELEIPEVEENISGSRLVCLTRAKNVKLIARSGTGRKFSFSPISG